MKKNNDVFLSLGSNIGNRFQNIENAIKMIKKHNIIIINNSSIYETEPVGFKEQNDFLNIALRVLTDKKPFELLMILQYIEKTIGRKKTFKWGPRILDIDILLYNDIIIKKEKLYIPHREIVNRFFILTMLREIEDIKLPGIDLMISEVLKKNQYMEKIKRVKFVNFT